MTDPEMTGPAPTPRRAFALESAADPRRRRNTVVVLLLAAVAVVAVVWALNSRRRDTTLDAMVAEMVPLIEKQTGLTYKSPPRLDTRSRAEVRQFLLAQLDDSATAAELRGQEMALKRLRLIKEEQSLRQIYLDVLEEQIAGFYDPRTDVLHVVDSIDASIRGITVTHELVHALQDQYVRLDSIQDVRGADDRQLAAHAVMEGQATLEQMIIMFGSDFSTLVPGGWEAVRTVIREEQSRMPRFSAAPIVVQEMLLFPYISGADYVKRFKEAKPGANVLENIPVSTEQLMHTGAFLTDVDEPTEVELPPLKGHTVLYQNTMGEFGTRIFLYEHLRRIDASVSGATGWDGDRYAVFQAGESTGLVWISVWDSKIEAAEFQNHVSDYLESSFQFARRRQMPGSRRQGAQDGIEHLVSGRVVWLTGATIGGRPGVVYVDVPEGMTTDVVDIRAVRLR
jgi:hypothetical protein